MRFMMRCADGLPVNSEDVMKITPEIVREVIDKKDIFVEFQPIYSINTKKKRRMIPWL